MKKKTENASIDELKNGYFLKERSIDKEKVYNCLFCNTGYDESTIYPFKKLLVTGNRAIKMHIYYEHGDVFNNLLALDKTQTGLTDTQKEFLSIYYNGLIYDNLISDNEIAEKMNISAATVRYQRHNFREKAKQAKIILAMAELLEAREKEIKTEKSVKPVDDNAKMLESLFVSLSPLVLKTFNMKKKKEEKRLLILQTIAQQFEKDRKYTNKEVDDILKAIYHDYATIRRALVDYGFMDRTSDCREYWGK